MLNSKFKLAMVLVAGSMLTACATNSKPASSGIDKNKSVSASACAGNAYLQKYGCSVQRISRAAQSGDPDAQYALGYMYYYGIGTIRDKQTARLWIKRAAEQGQPLAKKAEILMANGQHIHHLHRQGSSGSTSQYQYHSGSSGYSGTGHGTKKSSSNKIQYAKPKSVSSMNASTPDKPLNEVLPNYNNKQPSEKSNAVIKSLQKKSDDSKAPEVGGKVEPITSRDPRLLPQTTPNAPVVSAARNAMTAVEKQMMQIPKKHYTLQLMGGRNLDAIKAFIRKNHLEGKVSYYSAKLNHENWYMLIYGDYSTAMRAHAAAYDLPPELRQLHPWVKSYRIVHDEIRLRRIVS